MMFSDVADPIRRALQVLAADKGKFYWALLLCIFGAAVELAGVGSLFPFLSLLSKPELIDTNRLLHWLYEHGRFASVNEFLTWSGWAALFVFLFANAFLFAKNAWITRFCVGETERVSARLLSAYLRRPMLFHVTSNSGVLSKDVIEQSDQFTMGLLLSVMALIGDGAILVVLMALVLSLDWKTGLAVIGALGTILGIALTVTRRQIQELGRRNDEANGARFSFCLAALQSIKEIKTAGKEGFFVGLFQRHAQEMARCYSSFAILQMLPQSIMQFLAAATVIGIALYYIAAGNDLSTIMPTLIMYAVVGYRLMPSINRISGAVAQVRQTQAIIRNISLVLEQDDEVESARLDSGLKRSDPGGTAVEFRQIGFSYPGADRHIFGGLGLALAPNSLTCIVGASGSGKTTLIDLMLGLLPLDRGDILINGISIHGASESQWRAMFGYVPQSTYILDGTIAENIAFGVAAEAIDWERMRQVVRLCHLEDFVGAQAEGLHAQVGERGSRLSGGQRQRIGIARALYRDPPILVLDESTSSLDGISEMFIVETLQELKRIKTVILVAHRNSLVRHCDRIILVDRGAIAADGQYDQLSACSPLFTALMSDTAGTRE